MRTLILLALVGMLAFLALDSAGRTYPGWITEPYHGWKVTLFGMRLPAEVFVLALMLVVLRAFPRHERRARAENPPAPAATDEQALRDVNLMLERMERRIESLETILLDREARVKRTAEHD